MPRKRAKLLVKLLLLNPTLNPRKASRSHLMNSGEGGTGGSSAELEFDFECVFEPESDTLLGERFAAFVTCFAEVTDCGAAVVAVIGICRAMCVVDGVVAVVTVVAVL